VHDPLKVADTLYEPAAAYDVESTAVPLVSVPVPNTVEGLWVTSQKVTTPVAATGATVAVRVKLAPAAGAELEVAIVVVVAIRLGDALMVRASGVEVLPESAESPL
jgi:hypothetical protein